MLGLRRPQRYTSSLLYEMRWELQREADDLYVEMYVDAVPTENIGVQQCDDEAKQEEANEEKSETEPERPSCDC